MRPALILAAAAMMTSLPAQAGPFDWLVGKWCTPIEKGVRTCESWSGWSAGRMEGGTRTIRKGRVVSTERAVIRLSGGKAIYDASPGGAPPVPFTESARGPRSISFDNLAHDYPQRIRYWREGADLLAEISLADGTRSMRWHHRPVR